MHAPRPKSSKYLMADAIDRPNVGHNGIPGCLEICAAFTLLRGSKPDCHEISSRSSQVEQPVKIKERA